MDACHLQGSGASLEDRETVSPKQTNSYLQNWTLVRPQQNGVKRTGVRAHGSVHASGIRGKKSRDRRIPGLERSRAEWAGPAGAPREELEAWLGCRGPA